MAHQMGHALQLAEDIASSYEACAPRLWHPHLSWAWLGLSPSTFISEERGNLFDDDPRELWTSLSPEEIKQGLVEHTYLGARAWSSSMQSTTRNESPGAHFSLLRLSSLILHLWDLPQVLRIRFNLSKVIRSIQHSHHLWHAIKNAAGVALLSFPAFLPADSTSASSLSAACSSIISLRRRSQIFQFGGRSMGNHQLRLGVGDKFRFDIPCSISSIGESRGYI